MTKVDRPLRIYIKDVSSCLLHVCTMTAKYFRIPFEVIVVNPEMEKSPEIKEKKGGGKYPFLETIDG